MYKLPILNYSANWQRSKYRYSRYRNSTWLWNWNISYRDVKGILNNLSLDMLPEDSYPEHNGTIPPSEMVAHFRQWSKSLIFLLDVVIWYGVSFHIDSTPWNFKYSSHYSTSPHGFSTHNCLEKQFCFAKACSNTLSINLQLWIEKFELLVNKMSTDVSLQYYHLEEKIYSWIRRTCFV